MADTVLGRSTPVPTDRAIRVTIRRVDAVVRREAPAGDADRTAALEGMRRELSRHVALSGSYLRSFKLRGQITGVEFYYSGRAVRAWTRAELEGQLRYLGIPFSSIIVATSTAPTRAETVRNVVEGASRFVAGGGVAGVVADEVAADGTMPAPVDRKPLIYGLIAVVAGIIIAILAAVYA